MRIKNKTRYDTGVLKQMLYRVSRVKRATTIAEKWHRVVYRLRKVEIDLKVAAGRE